MTTWNYPNPLESDELKKSIGKWWTQEMNTTFKGQVDIYNPDYRVQSWKGNPNKVELWPISSERLAQLASIFF